MTTLEQVFLDIGHNPNPNPKYSTESGNLKSQTSDKSSNGRKNSVHSSPKTENEKDSQITLKKKVGNNRSIDQEGELHKTNHKLLVNGSVDKMTTKLDNLIAPGLIDTKGADDLYQGSQNFDDSIMPPDGIVAVNIGKSNPQDMEKQTPHTKEGS